MKQKCFLYKQILKKKIIRKKGKQTIGISNSWREIYKTKGARQVSQQPSI